MDEGLQLVQSARRAAVRPPILQFALTGSMSPHNFTVGELCGNHIITSRPQPNDEHRYCRRGDCLYP